MADRRKNFESDSDISSDEGDKNQNQKKPVQIKDPSGMCTVIQKNYSTKTFRNIFATSKNLEVKLKNYNHECLEMIFGMSIILSSKLLKSYKYFNAELLKECRYFRYDQHGELKIQRSSMD